MKYTKKFKTNRMDIQNVLNMMREFMPGRMGVERSSIVLWIFNTSLRSEVETELKMGAEREHQIQMGAELEHQMQMGLEREHQMRMGVEVSDPLKQNRIPHRMSLKIPMTGMNLTVEVTNVAVYVLARVVTELCEYCVPNDALVEDRRTFAE